MSWISWPLATVSLKERLVLPDAASVRMAVKELEDRYQAPVKAAWERRCAGALASAGPALVPIRTVSPAEGWELG